MTTNPILKSWIGGTTVDFAGSGNAQLVSPWDRSNVFQVQCGDEDAVNQAVESAFSTFTANKKATALQRREWLLAAADEVEKSVEEIARSSVRAIGKPIRAARFEANRTVAFMRACAEEIGHVTGEVLPVDIARTGAGRTGFTRRVPYGVIGAITPFNAPANLLMQKVAPAIAAGNAIVVKPSFEGTEVALIIAECFTRAGVPDGLFNVVTGRREEAQLLARHPNVPVLTLTGGNGAANALGTAAAAKPLFSELGGNSANIVLADADLADAATRIAASAFEASGQQCISAQRIIVEAPVFEEFSDLFIAATEVMKVGDPSDETTDLGPMINEKAALRVEAMIREAKANGATVACGGDRDGAIIPPTIVIDPPRDAAIVRQEIFGPAAVLIKVADVDEAIDVANDSDFGLQAACFTNNLSNTMRVSDEVQAGSIWINDASRFRLDLYPFGGMGLSGFGREGVKYAMEEFSQWKFTGIRKQGC
ncbi:aldehyde dehydrogenase family protein [Ruegeria atlantica]|uniref:aldehyde dehydrogenase family protein n=1 Tax=Ruegeria atlantica TaxID=81569 RepID=UPI00148034AE|nr:aldehyde dehydrogenase family protein [Ruegeria atlantica]